MLAQSSCDPSEKADSDQEATNRKCYEKAVEELRNSRKKARNSKQWKITARRTFSCSSCNRRYCSRMSLQRHLKCECGKEPSWGCLYCSYAGLYKSSLQKHIKNRHGGMPNVV